MPQEPIKNDNKLPRFGSKPSGGEDGQTPKKGPRFSIYWIYAIIFAVLIGFQIIDPLSPNMKEIDQDHFADILRQGDVDKYTVVSNRNVVRVNLKETSIPKYDAELKKGTNGKLSKDGPQMFFKIVSGDSFQV